MSSTSQKRSTAVVEAPRSMVGRVIGKNGNTIKALQQYSGALIQIDQTVDPTKVTISGTPHSLSLAVSMVTDIVKGTFKGFALLRQLSGQPPYRGTAAPSVPAGRPVYAPGYGLIPPSQLYGVDDRAAGPLGYGPSLAFLPQGGVQPMMQSALYPTYAAAGGPAAMMLGVGPQGGLMAAQQRAAFLPSNYAAMGLQGASGGVAGGGALPQGVAYAFPADYGAGVLGGDGMMQGYRMEAASRADAALLAGMGAPAPVMGANARLMQAAAGGKPRFDIGLDGGAGGGDAGGLGGNEGYLAMGPGGSAPGGSLAGGQQLLPVMDPQGRLFYFDQQSAQ